MPIVEDLRNAVAPWRLVYRPAVGSTNALADRMRREGRLAAPAVVVTRKQTAGKGRGRHTWHSDAGTLTATFVLPVGERVEPNLIPLLAGLAVRRAVLKLTDLSAELKWPNDLYLHGRKLAGLLCQRVSKADLIGIGLNLSTRLDKLPADVRSRATSLEAAGKKIDLPDALKAISQELTALLLHDEVSVASLLAEYDRHHLLGGREVVVDTSPPDSTVSGLCKGIDRMGRLVIISGKATHRVVSGEVVSW